MQPSVTLRPIRADDGARIAALSDQSADTGAVAIRNSFHHDPYATLMALHPNAVGVVAEASDHDGIVGMGMMSTGECYFEGALRPFAYLFSLSVHPAYRRRGIASQLAAWRIETARQMLGSDAVLFAGIQQGNEGSLRNAAKWSSQRIDERTTAGVVKLRTSPPTPVAGLSVRPAEVSEFEEIAEKQNAFYSAYNLYPPRTAEMIDAWHRIAPFGSPVRDYYVVVDQQGNILSGLSATEEGRLTSGHVTRMPVPLRLLNALVHVIPADGVTKRVQVKDLWFAPGRPDAGQYLWESLRWLWRTRGTMFMSFYDVQSPLAQIIRTPWYMPRQSGSLVIAAPAPMDEGKSFFMHA